MVGTVGNAIEVNDIDAAWTIEKKIDLSRHQLAQVLSV